MAESNGTGHYEVGCSVTAMAEEIIDGVVNTGLSMTCVWLLFMGFYPNTGLSILDRSDEL